MGMLPPPTPPNFENQTKIDVQWEYLMGKNAAAWRNEFVCVNEAWLNWLQLPKYALNK